MNSDPAENHFRELAWKRKLTDAEQSRLRAWLAGHPDAQADWETEERLNAILGSLPDAPLSSNFTARVMQAVEREAAPVAAEATGGWAWFIRSLLPRLAVATVVICAGVFTYQRHEAARRTELAQSVVAVAEVKSLPSVASLEDFEAIRRLGRTPPVDEELLALMQ